MSCLEAAVHHTRGSLAAGRDWNSVRISSIGLDETKCGEEPGDWAEELQAWMTGQGLDTDMLTQVIQQHWIWEFRFCPGTGVRHALGLPAHSHLRALPSFGVWLCLCTMPLGTTCQTLWGKGDAVLLRKPQWLKKKKKEKKTLSKIIIKKNTLQQRQHQQNMTRSEGHPWTYGWPEGYLGRVFSSLTTLLLSGVPRLHIPRTSEVLHFHYNFRNAKIPFFSKLLDYIVNVLKCKNMQNNIPAE